MHNLLAVGVPNYS